MGKAKSNIEIRNKKASFEYEFIETYTAGIVLTGTEIKSIRAGKASLVDSWCYFAGGELYVKNMHIAEYWWGTFNRHDPKRDRKLLLTRKELRKLARAVKEKGLTIVTRRLFISETGYAQRPATPSSTSPSPAAKRNTTSASPSRKRTCAATQSTKPAMSRRCLLASISYG